MPSDAVDDLYALPLDEFVTGRNALVKELRAAGDKERAKAVAALKKPSAAAWVVNQLARRAPEEVDAFLAAGAKVAAAQSSALRGGGSAPLKEAGVAERAALRDVLTRARPLAKNEALLNRVAGVLRAAVADDAVAEAVRSGRLTEEPELPAFGGLAGLDAGGAAQPSGDAAHDEEERRDAARREAERRAADLAERAARAEQEAARLGSRADAAEQEATRRRQAADLAREEAEELRRAADEATGEAG